jgi:hypothetical protein
VNVLRFRNSGDIQVTVRGPSPDGGLTCGPSAVMALARADFVKFMTDVLRDVAYGPEVKTTP